MKKFTKIMPAVVLAAASLSLSGCQDEDFGYTASEISYQKNFKSLYSKVDPAQDWNLAERASVDVSVSSTSEIKIFAKSGNGYKIVGDYQSVSGTQTLGVDVLEGTTELMVTNGETVQYTNIGGYVSFTGTRAGHYDTTGNITVSRNEDESSWLIFDKATAEKYQEKLPEGGKDWDGDGNKENNLGQVTQNFTFVSTGEFTIYPVFWDTSNTDEIGLYYTIGTNIYRVPIYTNKSGNELEYSSTNPSESFDFCNATDAYSNTQDKVGQYCAGCGSPVTPKLITKVGTGDGDEAGRAYHTKTTPIAWSNVTATPTSDHFTYGAMYERSRGVKVNIPAGTLFGMYCKPANGTYAYSESSLNSSLLSSCGFDVWGATFMLDDQLYLCFEDWQTSSCDADLNDVVFRFSGSNPITVDQDATPWILSCEDLGNTLDIDYNDVVLQVEHVSGKTEAKVTGLAAGGTLASFVYFGNECLGEIHSFFGVTETPASGGYTPINVDATKPAVAGFEKTITVDSEFSMSTSVISGTSQLDTNGSMGGFYIKVVPEGDASTEANAVGGQKIQNQWIGTSENVPYVICTPKIWERSTDATHKLTGWYRWPMENVPMKLVNGFGASGVAYDTDGHSFAAWVADHTESLDWYTYPNLSVTCAPTTPTVEEFQDPSLLASTIMAAPTDVTLYRSSGSVNVQFSYNGSGVVTCEDYDENLITVAITNNGSSGSNFISISPKTGAQSGSTTITVRQAANSTYRASSTTINVTYNDRELTASSFSLAKNETTLAHNAANESIAITDGVGSHSYSITGNTNPSVATATISGSNVVIDPVAGGTTSITVTQAAGGDYASSTQTILVTVTRDASGFSVSSTTLDMNANGEAKTISIWSKNTNKPSVSALTGSQIANIGEITSVGQDWSNNGMYKWTIEVTPTEIVADGSTFIIDQEPTETMEGGVQTITVNVAPEISNGVKLLLSYGQFSDGYKYFMYDMSKFISDLKETPNDDDEITFTIEIKDGLWGTMNFSGCNDLGSYAASATTIKVTNGFNGGKTSTVTVTYSQIKSYGYIGFTYVSSEDYVSGLYAK